MNVLGSSPVSGFIPNEFISIKVPFHGPGDYALGPNEVQFSELIGGDVQGAVYLPSESSPGRLRITAFEGVGRLIQGEVSFEASTTTPNARNGAKAELKNGFFGAMLQAPVTL